MRIICLVIALFTILPAFAQDQTVRLTQGKGDAAKFIINKAVEYGGSPNVEEALPEIKDTWAYTEDEYGVVIRLSVNNYKSIRDLLYLAFGSPNMGPYKVKSGILGVYRLTPNGGAIQFGVDDSTAQVVIMRLPDQVNMKNL